MRMPSLTQGQSRFAVAPQADIPRSAFDLTHGHKTTFDAGFLIPVVVEHAVPGDTFVMDATFFCRTATMLKPVMDNIYADIHFWAVPYRLLWENWERMNGAQDNPADTTDYMVPEITVPGGGFAFDSIWDYMGIPPGVEHSVITALVPRAYNLIWNEWYRDENLQDSIAKNIDDGPDLDTDYELKRRGKRHDYFTSALPWPQKGPAVELPLGTYAPVVEEGTGYPTFESASYGPFGLEGVTGTDNVKLINPIGGTQNLKWSDTALQADLSAATAATINQLRMAFQIQRLYERDARGGTRWTEILKSHWGVTSPDARLQRPEYLGGGTTTVHVNPVASNINANLASPAQWIGDLGAYGTMTTNVNWTKSFVEHSVVIGLISARADLTYQEGLNRHWFKQTRWDFYWPALQHIGEQTILNKEIYADGTATDEEVWGYQERYAEYRYKPSLITGKYRSSNPASLDIWHLSQEFGSLPALDSDFIEEDPPIDRIIAVPSQPHFQMDSYYVFKAVRPMATYSVPGLIDHF